MLHLIYRISICKRSIVPVIGRLSSRLNRPPSFEPIEIPIELRPKQSSLVECRDTLNAFEFAEYNNLCQTISIAMNGRLSNEGIASAKVPME